jgi:hypothetical protein
MGNAHERRKERRLLERLQALMNAEAQQKIVQTTPPTPAQKTPWYESTLLWGAIGAACGIVLAVLAALVRDSRWLLFVACPFIWLSLWAGSKSVNPKIAKVMLLVLVCLLFAWGLWWLYMALETPFFTAKQKQDFTTILKSGLAPPDATLIACPEANEDACVYAAGFIPLFQRAGWKVEGPTVERVKLGKPTLDIVIVIRGPPLAHPQNPDEGVWTQLPIFQQQLITAFEFVGLHPLSGNDPSLPKGKIRVYFGSSPYINAR